MLRKILFLAYRTGTLPIVDIARELKVSEALVRQLIDELVRLDYLLPVTSEASRPFCGHCPLNTTCFLRQQTQIWRITQKGIRLLSKNKDETVDLVGKLTGHRK